VEGAKPGNIILIHDDGGDRSKSVQALPEIIDQLRPRSYQFVTLYAMLQIKDQKLLKNPWFH
jgi:chitin deacetylase